VTLTIHLHPQPTLGVSGTISPLIFLYWG